MKDGEMLPFIRLLLPFSCDRMKCTISRILDIVMSHSSIVLKMRRTDVLVIRTSRCCKTIDARHILIFPKICRKDSFEFHG